MVRLATALAALFVAPTLAAPATECVTADLDDPVSMMQTDRIQVTSRHQFLNKQPRDEESADAPAEAAALEDAERVPFLASDYAIDGDSDTYLSDMEARVAADAAGQPEMVNRAVPPDEDAMSVEVEAEEPVEEVAEAPSEAAETPAEGSAESTAEESSETLGEESFEVPAVEPADVSGLEGFGESGNSSTDIMDIGTLADASAAPIVSDASTSSFDDIGALADVSAAPIVSDSSTSSFDDIGALADAPAPIVSGANASSFDDFGTNLYVMHNLSGLAGFGTPLEPVNEPDGNFVVDSNDPMGWRDYRPTEAPWPFETPRQDTGAEPAELSSSASGGGAYDEWEDYVHDDDNELDERDPDEVYHTMKRSRPFMHWGPEPK